MIALCAFTAHWCTGQGLSVSFVTSNYNGYEVSCFGGKDGNVQAVVTGGTPPYYYVWSTGTTSQSLTGYPAGYYKVDVTDATAHTIAADITLDEPLALKVSAAPYTYPGGLNISCYNCYNGSITPSVLQGVAPYSYLWSDGSTAPVRTNLGSASYGVTVTDANGCEASAESMFLEEPERSDWTMTGNAGTNPAVQYIGTSDNKDVVFRANGQEALRLKGNGSIRLMGNLTGTGPIVRGSDGTLRLGGESNLPSLPQNQCYSLSEFPYWSGAGNAFPSLCPQDQPRLGTLSEMPLRMITNGIQRMVISETGNVGIGTNSPGSLLTASSSDQRTVVELQNRAQGTNASNEIRFSKGSTQRWGLGSDFGMNGEQNFYLYDHQAPPLIPDGQPGQVRLLVDNLGRVAIGNPNLAASETFKLLVAGGARFDYASIGTSNNPSPDDYSLYVAKGILTERVKIALQSSTQWADYVFASDYKLLPLNDLACFIKEHGHLPSVLSADEVVEQGLDVTATTSILLAKVEELTLYVLQLKDEIEKLQVQSQITGR